MMKFSMFLIFFIFSIYCKAVLAIDDIAIDKIEIYTDKSKIPYLGSDGWAIPSGVKVAVLRTSNPTYASWKFVSYGDSFKEVLSLWILARALNKNINCISEDRGNYWVQCVGVVL
jgi:hypothetical protein